MQISQVLPHCNDEPYGPSPIVLNDPVMDFGTDNTPGGIQHVSSEDATNICQDHDIRHESILVPAPVFDLVPALTTISLR